MHSRVEHKFQGDPVTPDLEVHLVHLAPGDTQGVGAKVVIGVHYRKDQRVAATKLGLGRLNDAMKSMEGEIVSVPEINPSHFLPADRTRWYRYDGSLTSEPFSEYVSWFVMAEEKLVNPSDCDELERRAQQTPREIQALNHRIVLRSFDLAF